MPALRIVQGVQGRSWRRPALNRKSYPCQVCASLMDGASNATNPQRPTTHQRSASPGCRSCYTFRWYGTNPVAAAKNQEDGPNTRRAAVRACKYLRAMVNQYESTMQEVHKAARIHTQMSKGTAAATADYRPPSNISFFPLKFGRCRSEARSLHEHKL